MAGPIINENKKNRVNALQVAIVAFLSAALAACIGGYVNYVTTHDQIDAQASQVENNFLRTQRQSAYSKLLTDDKTVGLRLGTYEDDLSAYRHGASFTNLNRDSGAVADALNNMLLDISGIEILGDDNVASDAQALEGQEEGLRTFLDGFANIEVNDLVKTKYTVQGDDPIWNAIDAARKKFINDARKAIGAT